MTPEQREARRKFLGASEVAAVCGLDPFKSALDVWASKMGLFDSDAGEAAELGNELEPVILQRYANKTRTTLRKPETLFGAEPWIAASPDSISSAGRNVQAKAVGRFMAQHWDDGVPEYVQLQCQWEMLVTGLPVTDVAALICSTEFAIMEVRADAMMQGHLLDICRSFWFEHVVAQEIPEPDGGESASLILRALNPEQGGMLKAVPEFVVMVERHQALTAEVKQRTDEIEHLRNLMRMCIGSASGIQWPGGKVTWKTNKAGARPLLVRTYT